jgi:hypothetical protein
MPTAKRDLFDLILNWVFLSFILSAFYKAARGDWISLCIIFVIGVVLIASASLRLPATTRRRLTVAAFAGGVLINSVVAGYMIWSVVRFSEDMTESGLIWFFGPFAAIIVLVLLVSVLRFRRYLRKTYDQRDVV